MKIYYQESEHGCGISVTRSLINHFLKKEISRTELFNQVNISSKGISIFELETINRKYGILLDSYKLSTQELHKLELKEFFVLLIYRDNSEHFVIAKKHRYFYTLYDSDIGKVRISYQQLSGIFCGKVLFIEKIADPKNISISLHYKKEELSILQYKKLARNILIELGVFIFITLSLALNRLIFDEIVQSKSLDNLAVLIFISFLLVLCWVLAEYIREIYYLKDRQWYFKNIYEKLLERLRNKKIFFFSKLGKNQLLMVQDSVKTLSIFYSELFSSVIANLIISIFLLIYLAYLKFWFLLLILINLVAKFIYFYIAKKLDEEGAEKIWKSQIQIQKCDLN